MKKLLTLLAIFSVISVYTQEFIEFTSSETTNPNYEIIVSNDTIVNFDVKIPGMFINEIDSFARVNIKEHTRMDSVGFPEIPIVSFLVAIPECDRVNLQLTLLDSVLFNNYNIYPAPELVPDTTQGGAIALIEQFAYNRTAYETDAMFPGFVGETIDNSGAGLEIFS